MELLRTILSGAFFVLSAICFIMTFVFHAGTSKFERMNAGRLNLDKKKKFRISAGYWCDAGFVAFIILGVIISGAL